MPLVRVLVNPSVIGLVLSAKLINSAVFICEQVAAILASEDPGGALTGEDISLQIERANSLASNMPAVFVDIEACSFPGRVATHQRRADEIKEVFENLLGVSESHPVIAVWLKLVDAAYS